MSRWIIHIDMDAFFAAIEQRDNPEYRGKPVIVGGPGPRGVVSAASYEARRYGVHSAMPLTEARRRCPQGIFLPVSAAKYHAVSRQLLAILSAYTPLVEAISLDEAFLDVTGSDWLFGSALDIARHIKQSIKKELNLTASAGVAPNKFLAKTASDLDKPDGLVIIRIEDVAKKLHPLPITRLWGVGEKTASLLTAKGIHTIGALAGLSQAWLESNLGPWAVELHALANGIDPRPVIPNCEPKSMGRETTFPVDIADREAIKTVLLSLSDAVASRLRHSGYEGQTVTLKLRFASFTTFTRSRTLTAPTCLGDVIYATASEIFSGIALSEPLRLVGISVSHLTRPTYWQPSLFFQDPAKKVALANTLDKLAEKYGKQVVVRGRLMLPTIPALEAHKSE